VTGKRGEDRRMADREMRRQKKAASTKREALGKRQTAGPEKAGTADFLAKYQRPWNAFSWLLLLLHVLALASLLWFLLPQVEGRVRVVEGRALHHRSCGRICDEGIYIGDALFSCKPHWLTHSYACPQAFQQGSVLRGTYFEMPTLMSRLGITHPSLVLLGLQQDGRFLVSESPESIRESYFRNAWLLYAVFTVSFFALNSRNLDRRGSRGG
jgi:hypothetical protein